MTKPTRGTAGTDGRPLCWNREPMREYPANVGQHIVAESTDGMEVRTVQQVRLIPWPFSQECKSWASDPSTDPVPMAEKWRCEGCRHLPQHLVDLAFSRATERAARAAGSSKG